MYKSSEVVLSQVIQKVNTRIDSLTRGIHGAGPEDTKEQMRDERLWLTTWVLPSLESVFDREGGTISEFQIRYQNNLPIHGRL